MKNYLLLLIATILSASTFAQSTIDPLDWYKGVSKDSIKRYKIYDYHNDSSYVDTNLRLDKYIKLNLLRKDNINIQRFANQGENYNFLSYHNKSSLTPEMGFETKHINYLGVKDIKYYDVATPFTELAYKSGYYRGQFLDAFFAANLTPNLNFTIGYKGLRSVGNYINSLTSQGNLKTSINFRTKDDLYRLKAHFTFQDLLNQESGGIENDAFYTNNEANFSQRTAFAMNLTGATSFIKGKRIYINHSIKIPFLLDSLAGKFYIQHEGVGEDKYFLYSDENTAAVSANKYYYGSEVFDATQTSDSTNFRNMQNDVYLAFAGSQGKSYIKFGAGHNYQKYSYESLKVINDNYIIPAYIEGTTVSLKAAARLFPVENFDIEAKAAYNISGKYSDAFELEGKATLLINSKHRLGASIGVYGYYPEMQYWLYQSNYVSFNYYNKLEKQYKLDFKVYFESPTWFNAYLRYVNHKKYTYFDSLDKAIDLPEGTNEFPLNSINPVTTVQHDKDVNVVEVGLHKNFEYGVFGFDTKTTAQKALSGEEVFRVPSIITRNTIYYNDYWFRKALQIQIGVKSKYFTEFSSFKYNPMNGMYFRPKEDEQVMIGNFPIFDFFINARIRTARIFFEVQNFTQPLMKENNNFSAPHYPGADLTFRIGLVWNFFT